MKVEGKLTCDQLIVDNDANDYGYIMMTPGIIRVNAKYEKGNVWVGAGYSSATVRVDWGENRTAKMQVGDYEERVIVGSDMGDRSCAIMEVDGNCRDFKEDERGRITVHGVKGSVNEPDTGGKRVEVGVDNDNSSMVVTYDEFGAIGRLKKDLSSLG